MCDIFGGASGEEQGLEAQGSALSRTLNANYATTFADQMDALKQLQTDVSQIRSGQTGPGFGADELAARTSQIVNQAGANARNVEQAEANASAGQTFGGASDASGLARASAIRQQLTGEAESAAETQKSNALENLTAANYEQGRRNAITTASGLDALSGAYGSSASTSLSGALKAQDQAFGQAKDINAQNQQASAMLGGLLKAGVGLGGTFLTGGLSNLGSGESFGEGLSDFLSGGTKAVQGQG